MPYNVLETQRLCRHVENGTHRLMPGGELVEALYKQLKEADVLIAEQDRLLRAGQRDGRTEPPVAPIAFTPARILPSEGNPTGATKEGTSSTVTAPAGLTPQRQLAPPRTDGFNPFMATGGVEAPPPVPYEATPGGAPPPPPLQPPPSPAKRGRKIKLK